MKAIGAHRYGGPEVLEVVELPDPEPGAGEVLVRVRAAAVNPTDTYVRNGERERAPRNQSTPPYLPRLHVASALKANGPGVAPDPAFAARGVAVRGPHGTPHAPS